MRIEPLISSNGGSACTTHLIVDNVIYPATAIRMFVPKEIVEETEQFTGKVSMYADNFIVWNNANVTDVEYLKKIDGVYQNNYGAFSSTQELLNYFSEIVNPIPA